MFQLMECGPTGVMEPVPSHAAAGPIQEREPALLLHLSMVAFTAQVTTLMPSPAMNTRAQVSLSIHDISVLSVVITLWHLSHCFTGYLLMLHGMV